MPDRIDSILEALARVVDPERRKDIVRLGLVRDLRDEGTRVSLTVVLDDPTTAFARTVAAQCEDAVRQTLGPGVEVSVATDNRFVPLATDQGDDPGALAGVRHVIAVASGKGGVGKSTVAVNLAVALARQGYDVGLVDTDIYGPSIPVMMGIEGARPRVNEQRRLLPVDAHGVRVLSMGFLVDPDRAVIWRGPMVSSAVKQFLSDTEWGELDVLVMDLPPGTGDIQLTIVQTAPLAGAVIVSTPQKVALADARKGVAMFQQVDVPVLGIVENMAYFEPPELPGRRYHLFGEGGARRLAQELDVPLLGEIPIEEPLREACDGGIPVAATGLGVAARVFDGIARNVMHQVARRDALLPAARQVEILYR